MPDKSVIVHLLWDSNRHWLHLCIVYYWYYFFEAFRGLQTCLFRVLYVS